MRKKSFRNLDHQHLPLLHNQSVLLTMNPIITITIQGNISQDTIPMMIHIHIVHPILTQDLVQKTLPGPLLIDVHLLNLPVEVDSLRKLNDHKDLTVVITHKSVLMQWLFVPPVILLNHDMKVSNDPTTVQLVPICASFLKRKHSIHQPNLIGLRMSFHLVAASDAIHQHMKIITALRLLLLVPKFVITVGFFIILPMSVSTRLVIYKLIIDPRTYLLITNV